MFALLMHIPETTAFSLRLLAIGFILVLPFLVMNAEQIKRARLFIGGLMAVAFGVVVLPVTLRATVYIATACEDWDWLVSEYGYAAAYLYWAIYC